MKHKGILFTCIFFLSFICCNSPEPIYQDASEINVNSDPIQGSDISKKAIVISGKNYFFTIKPIASYRISGIVKSKKKYSNGWQSLLSPIDVALVWGKLAESEMDKFISYHQNNRWYFYKYKEGTPVSKEYIISHSSNNHLIPSSNYIKKAFKLIDEGKSIFIEGYLVNIIGNYKGKNFWWNSSLTRTDSGNGSCELIYVTKINIEGKGFANL